MYSAERCGGVEQKEGGSAGAAHSELVVIILVESGVLVESAFFGHTTELSSKM